MQWCYRTGSWFTELILTGERVEAGIRSGKIQKNTSSSIENKSFGGKREANVVHGQKGRSKADYHQSVGAVLISNSACAQQPQQQNNQPRVEIPQRQFTQINMPLSQALQHMLRMNLTTLIEPHPNPKTPSPNYNLGARCVYHSDSPRRDTNNC